jgi:acylphosphatase
LAKSTPFANLKNMAMRMTAASTFDSGYPQRTLPLQRRHVYFSGRVQGVGFRYTAKNIAMRFDVCGYVRNLPDGRVELIMEGPADEVEQMTHAVEDRMSDYIQKVETATPPPTGEFAYFQIRH